MSDATTTLLDSYDRTPDADGTVSFMMSGDGHCKAIVNAVTARYNALLGRPKPTVEQLEALIDQKVTLIKAATNAYGAPGITAMEGTLFAGKTGHLALLPKRAKRNGYQITPSDIIDLFLGYGHTGDAAGLVNEARGHFPYLTEIDHERLCELPEYDLDSEVSESITLCAFGTWKMPDSTAVDAIQLIATYDKENDICDGGVLLIRPEHGTSEHGSSYGRQIISNFGEVQGFEPITFKEGIDLCDIPFGEAYERIITPAVVA